LCTPIWQLDDQVDLSSIRIRVNAMIGSLVHTEL
jgi:hypothetical protein